jgi:hypothetical protein
MKKKVITLVGILLIAINLSKLLNQNKEIYHQRFDLERTEGKYQESQYVRPSDHKTVMGDDELYSLAGVKYIEGEDPSKISFELQPLTKYLFGISIKLFGNPLVIQFLIGILLLAMTAYPGRLLGLGKLAIVPVALLSFDKLFQEQIMTAQLDLFQALAFQVYWVLFYLAMKKNSTSWTWVMIWLGIGALSKSFSIGVLAFGISLIFLFWQKRSLLKSYIRNSILAVVVYFLGYLMFFITGNGLIDFFWLHWRILKLYAGYVPEYPKGEILRIIFLGKWREWYGNFGLMKVKAWSILWAVGFLAVVGSLLRRTKSIRQAQDSRTNFAMLLSFWSLIYLVFIGLRLVFPRYLMVVLPNLYLLIIYYLMDRTISTRRLDSS